MSVVHPSYGSLLVRNIWNAVTAVMADHGAGPSRCIAVSAASVLGPLAVGRLIDACFAARMSIRDADGRHDQAASDRYNELRTRIYHTPGASSVTELIGVVRKLPDAQRSPQLLEEMIRGLGDSPFAEAEDLLFKMATDDPRFYRNHQWREIVLGLATDSATRHLVDLTVSGELNSNSADSFRWGSDLGKLVSDLPKVNAYVHGILKSAAPVKHLAVLAGALAHNPGADGVLALVDFEIRTGRSVRSWHSIEKVVIEHVPSESWKGAYNVVPVEAGGLRKELLAIAKAAGDPATRCLNAIDRIRDEYGALEDEPRHPDLASGKHWPMLTPDPGGE